MKKPKRKMRPAEALVQQAEDLKNKAMRDAPDGMFIDQWQENLKQGFCDELTPPPDPPDLPEDTP